MWRKLFGKRNMTVVVRGDCNQFAMGRISGVIQGVLGYDINDDKTYRNCMTLGGNRHDNATYITISGYHITYAQRDRIEKLIGRVYPKHITIYMW